MGGVSINIGSELTEEVGDSHTEQVGKSWLVKAGQTAVIEAPMGITLKCGGNSVVLDPTGVTIKGTMVVIDGSMTRINSGPGSPPAFVEPGKLVRPAPPEMPDAADEADPGRGRVGQGGTAQDQEWQVRLEPGTGLRAAGSGGTCARRARRVL